MPVKNIDFGVEISNCKLMGIYKEFPRKFCGRSYKIDISFTVSGIQTWETIHIDDKDFEKQTIDFFENGENKLVLSNGIIFLNTHIYYVIVTPNNLSGFFSEGLKYFYFHKEEFERLKKWIELDEKLENEYNNEDYQEEDQEENDYFTGCKLLSFRETLSSYLLEFSYKNKDEKIYNNIEIFDSYFEGKFLELFRDEIDEVILSNSSVFYATLYKTDNGYGGYEIKMYINEKPPVVYHFYKEEFERLIHYIELQEKP